MTTQAALARSRRGLARGLAVCGAVALLALAPARAPGAAQDGDAAGFVRDFSEQAIALLADADLSGQRREQAFRGLFTEGFDVAAIGRFVLGRYWRAASEAERAEFTRLFEDLIVATYSHRFESYGGETLKVEGARRQEETSATVASRILRAEGEPIRVDWRLRRRASGWRIVDVVVEGVSMALTQRSEFAAVIRASGGRVEGLLEKLREKTARLKAAGVQKAESAD